MRALSNLALRTPVYMPFLRFLTPCPRLTINGSDHSTNSNPVRHPPVHALDPIILQAQVLTPSDGRERPFNVHRVRTAAQLRYLNLRGVQYRFRALDTGTQYTPVFTKPSCP